jgi:putative molybdopterin biosynthesis protein
MEIGATLTRKMTSPAGDDDFVRVAVGKVGKRTLAAPLSRGSGVITSLVRADGIVIVPSGSQGYPAGEQVKVRLYRSLKEIEKTIFAIGSHDITLDILAQFVSQHDRRLASANVGSLGGLMALKRGEAHLAGAHLLDPETGEYNLPYIKEYLPDMPVRVITLVGRTQGLFVPRGNPKDVQGIQDLAREDVTFINRQRGAGTRLLLDYRLQQEGIDPQDVRGYNQEEYTHLTAAAAVASGRVDCALGIKAAAEALDLDFLPIDHERYDLIIPQTYAESDLLEPLLRLLKDPAFRRTVSARPGYDISVMGELVADLG